MRKLLRQIRRELKTAKHCAIYEEELVRMWPDDGNQREPKIRAICCGPWLSPAGLS
jgi:hypothetical protein